MAAPSENWPAPSATGRAGVQRRKQLPAREAAFRAVNAGASRTTEYPWRIGFLQELTGKVANQQVVTE